MGVGGAPYATALTLSVIYDDALYEKILETFYRETESGGRGEKP